MCRKRTLKWRTGRQSGGPEDAPLHQLGRHNGRTLRAGDFVNYATLGYGDVLPVERWRLLGPLTAMNGMLLYGWSTAVIFEILRRTLVRTLDITD